MRHWYYSWSLINMHVWRKRNEVKIQRFIAVLTCLKWSSGELSWDWAARRKDWLGRGNENWRVLFDSWKWFCAIVECWLWEKGPAAHDLCMGLKKLQRTKLHRSSWWKMRCNIMLRQLLPCELLFFWRATIDYLACSLWLDYEYCLPI